MSRPHDYSKPPKRNAAGQYLPVPVEERFWKKVQKSDDPNGCWLWTAGKIPAGYGMFWVDGRHHGAHRVAYELVKGPIPEELQIDHLCRNKSCVNPDHLEPVTQRENWLRGPNRGAITIRTGYCKNGHPFVGDNILVNNNGSRQCRPCAKETKKRHAARKRQKTQRESEA